MFGNLCDCLTEGIHHMITSSSKNDNMDLIANTDTQGISTKSKKANSKKKKKAELRIAYLARSLHQNLSCNFFKSLTIFIGSFFYNSFK